MMTVAWMDRGGGLRRRSGGPLMVFVADPPDGCEGEGERAGQRS